MSSRCAECGCKPGFATKENIVEEIVYMATRHVDEPWLCKECRVNL